MLGPKFFVTPINNTAKTLQSAVEDINNIFCRINNIFAVRFSDVFGGHRKGCIGNKRIKIARQRFEKTYKG